MSKIFNPSLREISDGKWEASSRLPVVGDVSVTANSWQEAKMSMWLISEALKLLEETKCKDPLEWKEAEWRSTLKIMRDVMSPNKDSATPVR